MANGSMMRFLKNISIIAGGIAGTSVIGIFLWVTFAQSKVRSEMAQEWTKDKGYRAEVVDIADSTSQTYVDPLYERSARMYFNQEAMMTEKQKERGKQKYEEYLLNLKNGKRK